jgi:hypothetical protein
MSQFVETCNALIVPVVSLEDKNNTAVVNETSHEESCMSQQVVQHGFLPESQLGKRRIQDDLVRAEIRSRNLLCDKMEIEHKQFTITHKMEKEQSIITHKMQNEQSIITHKMENEKKIFDNRMSTVNNFAATMDLLDPLWRQDKKLMGQTQDYVKNSIFKESSTLELENGGFESD